MQQPNRLGLGLRPPLPNYPGQGPPMGGFPPPNAQFRGYGPPGMPNGMEKLTTLFVGSISAGVSDEFLARLFSTCGPLRGFKRLTNPNGKPQGFGFAEFEEPDSVSRALSFLHGKTIPALETGTANKNLIVRADDKTKAFLQQYEAQRIRTDQDNEADQRAQAAIAGLLKETADSAAEQGITTFDITGAIPPHLRDLQEADLPENQRGLVISEIALFRERSAKREAMQAERQGHVAGRSAGVGGFGTPTPSAPKERVWGRPKEQSQQQQSPQRGWGNGAQGYQQAPGFVKGEPAVAGRDDEKSDEELERERRNARRREEDESFRDRERRYESRESQKIYNIERQIMRQRQELETKERESIELRDRLHIWDDDESDEVFYTDRAQWRTRRARQLATERTADEKSRALEERQAEHLRLESETFLQKQMSEMQSLAEEQRKAGLLLEDGAPVKLSIGEIVVPQKQAAKPTTTTSVAAKPPPAVFGLEEEDEGLQKRKAPLVKIDFGGIEQSGRQERLDKLRAGIKKDKESLWKTKIRWDAINDNLIDHKLERLTKHKMREYQVEDDDLVSFVSEHLKDHKTPAKLVEGLEPVLEEEAEELVIALWRQVVFESLAYAEGLETEDMWVD